MSQPENGTLDKPELDPLSEDEKPPVLGSWTNVYAFVLGLHAIIIVLFYLFSRAYA